MSSILRAQFENLSDAEALRRASYLKANIWSLLTAEIPDDLITLQALIEKIDHLRTQFSWVLVLVASRDLAFEDDGLLECCKEFLRKLGKLYYNMINETAGFTIPTDVKKE